MLEKRTAPESLTLSVFVSHKVFLFWGCYFFLGFSFGGCFCGIVVSLGFFFFFLVFLVECWWLFFFFDVLCGVLVLGGVFVFFFFGVFCCCLLGVGAGVFFLVLLCLGFVGGSWVSPPHG